MHQLPTGTVIYVDLGLPPSTKGHEQQKRRRCMVVVHWPALKLLMIVPISGSKPPVELYTTVELKANGNGLTKDSFALCHQMRSVSDKRLGPTIGRLHALDVEKIKAVVKGMLGL
ncbi:MAG: type II toxin-antitoxin system PemK/MazF family toxin [Bacteroidetes bacterium]|nr:type II toxin-antitoxin system PemK/MazF family toxin [Bacteroidota bacterium]